MQHLPDAKQQRGRNSAKQGFWALNQGQERCRRKQRSHLLWDLLLPPPPAQPSPGAHHPPPTDTGKPEPGAIGGVFVVLSRCPGLCRGAHGHTARRPSKQQGFLLEVIPFPEGQAVKLFHAHPKHFLEILGRQVPLQTNRESQRGAVSNAVTRAAGRAPCCWVVQRRARRPGGRGLPLRALCIPAVPTLQRTAPNKETRLGARPNRTQAGTCAHVQSSIVPGGQNTGTTQLPKRGPCTQWSVVWPREAAKA